MRCFSAANVFELPRRPREGAWVLLGFWLGLVSAPGCYEPTVLPPSQPPSIVLIVVDSLAAQHTGLLGSSRATTPCIDAFAQGATLFANARSQTAWTLPSVASLFTGLSQEQHGLRQRDQGLSSELPTLAEHLGAKGYRTHAILQNAILDPATGIARGFEHCHSLGWDNQAARDAVSMAAEVVARPSELPLLLYVHLAPPHMPYLPPAPYRDAFSEPGARAMASGSVEECRFVHRQGLGPHDARVLALARRYDEHVLFADALVGELLEAVERPHNGPGSSPGSPLICLLSDHGEAFMEHGAQGHNASVHEEMLRVPWLLKGPGVPAGERVQRPVVLQDVAPTLLELAGLAALPGSKALNHPDAGRSQVAALEPATGGLAQTQRQLFFSSRYATGVPLQLALLAGSEKLVTTALGHDSLLFDLSLDPGETFDLGLERPQRKAELRATALERYAARRAGQPRGVGGALSDLAALGYVEPVIVEPEPSDPGQSDQ